MKDNNIGQCVQSSTVWYRGCWEWYTPEAQCLSNILVHTKQTHGIHCIEIFHGKFWALFKYYIVYSTLSLHGVSCVAQNMAIQGTEFFTLKLQSCVWHILSVLNMILMICIISLTGTLSIFNLVYRTIFTWWFWKIFLKLPC